MTRNALIAVCLLVVGLAAWAGDQPVEKAPTLKATVLEGEKGPYLMGPVTREAWLGFEPELQLAYEEYQPAPDLVRALSYLKQDATITCVLGTWCSDSRREVPRLWKLLDEMNHPGLELIMLATSRLEAPEADVWREEHGILPGYRDRFDVELVPTFIVTVDGEEVGRIVETPEVSLEADLAAMFSVNPTPAWH